MYSRLINTPIGQGAKDYMQETELPYHNWDHVLSCYEFLSGLSYDINLDTAVLWHDVVYDNQPKKELRSYKALEDYVYENNLALAGLNLDIVRDIIMSTTNHIIYPNSTRQQAAMIRADLSGFTRGNTCLHNFIALQKEDYMLNNSSPYSHSIKTSGFMDRIEKAVIKNIVNDSRYLDFWQKAWTGVQEVKFYCAAVKRV